MSIYTSYSPEERALELVQNYLKPQLNLMTMERLHRNFTGEDVEFTRWVQVEDKYQEINWTDQNVTTFVDRCKQITEDDVERLPETYFTLTYPSEFDIEDTEDELNRFPFDGDAEGEERAGFKYDRVGENIIQGRYVYVDVDTKISESGEMYPLVREDVIEFQIKVDENLLIANSTSVVAIQKLKAAFNKKTNFEIHVSGDFTAYHEEAPEKMDDFRASFSQDIEGADDDVPVLFEIESLKIHNPNAEIEDEDLKNIDFEGSDIAENPQINEYLDNGWIIKSITFHIRYEDNLYEVTVAGTSVLSYVKIDNILNSDDARELMDDLQGRFLDHFRFV